ncbi:MAG: hypothetical protein E7638_00820 [Ruminococcaceae bacterium]|nr:hypothetical protein [Oscillospiraceae bacterium]
MFGYVKPHVPELRVGEYELFRAVYCGVCRSMGRHTGTVSRFTLNYDYVFLAAVRMAVRNEVPECAARRCIAHPMKRRSMAEDNDSLAYTAAAAACMLSEKMSDDIADEGGFKVLLSRMGSPVVRGMVRRAGEQNSPSASRISELTKKLYDLEAAGSSSVDETAAAFGDVLAYVFSSGLSGSEETIAREIGRAAGRFIYVCDAADDLVDDIKKGRYNPIHKLWGEMATEDRDGKIVMSSLTSESVRTATRIDLEKLGLAVELLPRGNPLLPIIKNTVYLGMPKAMDKILGEPTEMNGVYN